jgi:hypothetical protein
MIFFLLYFFGKRKPLITGKATETFAINVIIFVVTDDELK